MTTQWPQDGEFQTSVRTWVTDDGRFGFSIMVNDRQFFRCKGLYLTREDAKEVANECYNRFVEMIKKTGLAEPIADIGSQSTH
jgi:hypothetical protein